MWLVMNFGDQVHIVPSYDERTHLFIDCWCHPRSDETDDDMIIHYALDRRELYEIKGVTTWQ